MDSASQSEPHRQPVRRARGPLRRIVYPLLVIAAIAAVIWYIDYSRSGDSVSSTGQHYGPVDLPASLAPAGAKVSADAGSLAPDFLLEGLVGSDLRLSGFRGHPVLLNFWATWCEPCRKEMPQFVSAYDRLKDKGLVVLAVNLQEGKSVIQPFADDFGMKFAIALDRTGAVGDRYHLLGLPTTFFIDPNGRVASVYMGPLLEQRQSTNVQGAIGQSDLDQRIGQIMAVPAANPGPVSSGGSR